jgi:hypothetical protein
MEVEGTLDLTKLDPEPAPLDEAISPSDVHKPFACFPPDDVARVVPAHAIALEKRGGRFCGAIPVPNEDRGPADVQEPLAAGGHLALLFVEHEGAAVRAREPDWIWRLAIGRDRLWNPRERTRGGNLGRPVKIEKFRPLPKSPQLPQLPRREHFTTEGDQPEVRRVMRRQISKSHEHHQCRGGRAPDRQPAARDEPRELLRISSELFRNQIQRRTVLDREVNIKHGIIEVKWRVIAEPIFFGRGKYRRAPLDEAHCVPMCNRSAFRHPRGAGRIQDVGKVARARRNAGRRRAALQSIGERRRLHRRAS